MLQANAQVYRSSFNECSKEETAEITVSFSGSTATYTRRLVATNERDKVNFYNTTSLPYVPSGNGASIILLQTVTYWIIRFDGTAPERCYGSVTITCECLGNGNCAVTNAGSAGKTCDPYPTCGECCSMTVTGATIHPGVGGILVQAERVNAN